MGYDMYRLDANRNRVGSWNDEEGPDGLGPCYFRRNIWGIDALRDTLHELGMGFWSNVPDFDWQNAAQEERDQFLSATYNEAPGIALHKFCSNDGWVVTPLECKTALQIWERLDLEPPECFGEDFLPFLRACAASGGMVVW